jgi:hypothetical protein
MKFQSRKLSIVLLLVLIVFTSAKMLNMVQPPTGHTGSTAGVNCTTGCHSGNPLNNTGGSVVINGLPSSYTPGTAYNFSVVVTHGAANRIRWGFSVKAVGTNNNDVGTFSTTATNAAVNGAELSHFNAPFAPMGNTFTFTNLKWTAPAAPTAQEQSLTFYVAGNAANGNDDNSGDFIYTATKTVTLTPTSVNELVPGVQTWKALNNPSAQTITVLYTLSEPAVIGFAVYDMNGRLLQTETDRKLPVGNHQQQINAAKLQSGMYIIKMMRGKHLASQKVFVH